MSPTQMVREFRDLSLELIDRPVLDVRIERDPDKLEELARDILRRGVIFPLAVVRVGDRYEVVDGFRRYLASRSAGLASVPCLVYPTKEAALEGVKYAANAFREDMSPAEEAIFFNELLHHECGDDLEQVCALVNKKLSYVDDRLALLNGDELIFDALRQRQISIGVAHELNKCTDARYRRYYLEHAMLEGSTVAVVTGWIAQWKATLGAPVPAAPAPEPVAQVVASSSYDPHRCYICGENDPRFIPEQVAIHTHCKIAILDKLLRAARGESSLGA